MHASILGNVRAWLTGTVMLAGAVACGTAQAAVYVVDWDPLFNPAFGSFAGNPANLGWKGSATVTVSAGCLVPGFNTVGVGLCSSATLNSFALNFYDTVSLAALPGSASGLGGLPAITTVHVDGTGNVDGIDMLGQIDIAGSTTFGATNSWFRSLDFVLTPFFGPTLRLQSCAPGPDCVEPIAFGSATSGDNAPKSVWTAVPEPTPLALLLAAVAAMALTRRRQA